MIEKKVFRVLKVVELILTIIAIILLTLLFRFETTNLRFVFLLLDIYLIYSFSKSLSHFEKRIEMNRKSCLRKDLEIVTY